MRRRTTDSSILPVPDDAVIVLCNLPDPDEGPRELVIIKRRDLRDVSELSPDTQKRIAAAKLRFDIGDSK